VSKWGGVGRLQNGGGWIVDELLFRFLVDIEIKKAQRLRYSVSLVCLSAEPGPFGGPGASSTLEERLAPHLRGTDAVAPWTQSWLGLLLVDAEANHLPGILHRLTMRLEIVAWSAGGSCYPRTASRTEDLFQQAIDFMGKAKEDGGNRLYVASS
jgi:hypothetical protein